MSKVGLELYWAAQEGYMTHQIDQDEVRNAMMQLQEYVGVIQGEVHIQHV
jgi:hypothetical protein